MTNNNQNRSPFCEFDNLLRQSCATYLEIERIYNVLAEATSNAGVATIEKSNVSLTELMQEAYRIDSLIAEGLASDGRLGQSNQAFLQSREEILYRLMKQNRILVNKAENIKSLLKHEITDMTKNRNAIKGYRPADVGRKNIISSSC